MSLFFYSELKRRAKAAKKAEEKAEKAKVLAEKEAQDGAKKAPKAAAIDEETLDPRVSCVFFPRA